MKRYVFAGQVVAMQHNGELFFLRPDHLGSASLIQDDAGRWLADHRFYPYGETRRSDGASESYPTDKLFTGMLKKQRLGIYRMGARWYDASISRWLSPDIIFPDPANPQSLNRYSWVLGNPLRYTDPTGYLSQDQIMRLFGLDPEVDGWDAVLAHFYEDGSMEGEWGFLAALLDLDGPYVLLAGIGAVFVPAATLAYAAKHPFPRARGTCG